MGSVGHDGAPSRPAGRRPRPARSSASFCGRARRARATATRAASLPTAAAPRATARTRTLRCVGTGRRARPLHVEPVVHLVARLVVVLPRRLGVRRRARGSRVPTGSVGPHDVEPGLGDAPLQVLGVLGPPEQVGVRHADRSITERWMSAPHQPWPCTVSPVSAHCTVASTTRSGRARRAGSRARRASGTQSSSITQAQSSAAVEERGERRRVPTRRAEVLVRAGARRRPDRSATTVVDRLVARVVGDEHLRDGSVWSASAPRHCASERGALWVSTTAATPLRRVFSLPLTAPATYVGWPWYATLGIASRVRDIRAPA